MAKNLKENLQKLVDENVISVAKDTKGKYYYMINNDDGIAAAYLPYENEIGKALKKLYFTQYGEFLSQQDIQNAIDMFEIMGAEKVEEIEVCKRIYNNGFQYAYELNKDTGDVLWIENGKASIEKMEGVIFHYAVNYANQVIPDLSVKPKQLLKYMRCHFCLENDNEVKLLTLFLVTSFWGLGINHPLLILTGEKGSSKSTTLRKLDLLIDPKTSDLGGGIPKGSDGLAIRLSNSYFVPLDNLSSLTRKTSDMLAIAITGGSVTKRALYKNSEEVVLDVKAVVAVNGVSLVAKESDLLDRSLIINLKRIPPEKITTEEKLWAEFEADRAKILGCCFNILASALNDTEEVKLNKLIRMADFQIACVKVGKVLGISEDEVSALLWENQKIVNTCTLDEDTVGLCVIELMKDKKKYQGSVSQLLCDLLDIADRNGMPSTVLPRTPNHLSIRLDKARSNLEAVGKITYYIKNIGAFKQIVIIKK